MILFNGKLSIESLPLIHDRGLLNDTDILRLDEPSGEVARILTQGEARYIAYVEFAPTDAPVIRGNHYHIRRSEYIYVVSGEVESYFLDLETGGRYEQVLRRGDLVLQKPGCVHAYVARAFATAIEYSPDALDLTDRVMHRIV